MRPDEGKIEVLMGLKLHKGKRELQRLLRLIRAFDYLRQFIPNISTIIPALRQLLKQNLCCVRSEAHTEVLNKLKQIVASPQVLKNFDPEKEIKIQCDR